MNWHRQLTALGAGCILAGSMAIALANQLPGDMISGRVTAVAGNGSITVDGKMYRVKSDSPAAAAARNLAPGQVVDVQLNGPANSSATEVVNVVAHGTR